MAVSGTRGCGRLSVPSSVARPPGRGQAPGAGLVAIALALVAVFASRPVRADDGAPPKFEEYQHFTIDPIVDGVLTGGGFAFEELLGQLLNTGEIRPSPPGPGTHLLDIDQGAVTQKIDPNASARSGYGLLLAYAFAVLDPVRAGVHDGWRSLVVDGILYAESIALTQVLTDVTKFAVRRPRPIDYAQCSGTAPTDMCANNTDLQLSFFSGHASVTAAISATATYLAFARERRGWRPWATLAAGMVLTSFVSYERVRSGMHFPTDVMVGSMVGASIGVLVPHFHRRAHYHWKELETPSVLIGFAPTRSGAGALTATWIF